MDNIETAAAIFAAARTDHKAIDGLPADCAPACSEDGYAIQKAFINLWDDKLAGWKVGATAPQAQALFGTDEPFYGPLFARDILQNPAKLASRHYHVFGVEAEFAFVFAKDLPPNPEPLSRRAILEYLGAAHIAIEFVSPRLDKPAGYGIAQLIADGAGNGAVVLGPEIENWRDRDLSQEGASMFIDGNEVAAGTGAEVLGHPLSSLIWFAARAGGHGHTVKRGSVVITGSCTGLKMAGPGAGVVADFGGLGKVSLSLT